ncbi:hypothetical protein OSB04_030213 [Centaurea solstitialis]|uniref:Protein NRT1/ PTR FAMILY 1.2-like n=1 Tax=Centaurea solstitialis TaxID=347529 RepID=A0AA38S750_9ASTR|nr:hypothetical protein OSB04_030213 [Centaurea solstitialis]
MIIYLMNDYKIGVAKGTNILFLWSAATNFAPIIGAFLSDSYLGRFLTIGLGSLFSLMGTFLLWLTTMVPQLKPPSCNQLTQTCKPPTTSQFAFLIFAFILISIGAGGVRPCSLAFGAQQIDKKDNNPNNKRALESFFGWYYAAGATAVLIAFTGVVYIQDHAGWKVGFGVPVVFMFLSAVLFFVASSLYVKTKVEKSVFTSFVQVIVVAYKNRKIVVGPTDSERWYCCRKDSHAVPTKRLRFLNKACIIQNPKDLTPDGTASDPWTLCTVEQVEELKSLIRVLPIWSAGLMMSINVSQSSFPVIQASTMDRHLGNFQVPAASFPFFTIATLAIWVVLYDRFIIPSLSKLLGKKFHVGVKLRMGIGLVISTVAMVISAIVEDIRRKKAIEEGLLNDPQLVVKMSAMWLVPQYCLHGLAEAFSAIGQNEFYYSELPKSMSSTAASLFLVGMAVANLLASGILSAVENLTKTSSGEGWIATNINRGRYDRYYWVLALMSFGNLFYFVACSWAYGPCKYETVEKEGPTEGSESPRSLACR